MSPTLKNNQIMSRDWLKYKMRFIAAALIISYAYLHMRLTGLYVLVPFEAFVQLTTPLPFAQRMLVPAIAHVLAPWLNLSAFELFFLLEVVFTGLLFVSMFQLLQREFDEKPAYFLTWLFFLLLPLVSVINYRWSRFNGVCPFYYPYDTSTLFFMTVGYRYCLQARWLSLALWLVLATFNRETSILLILLMPALHGLSVFKQPTAALPLLAYCLTRGVLYVVLQDNEGLWLEFFRVDRSCSLLATNLRWLLTEENVLMFIYCFACLPLYWFAFIDYIPLRYRAVRYVVLVHVISLLLVGVFPEARIFGESVVLMYLPICVAMSRWLHGQEPYRLPNASAFACIDRYAVFIILTACVLCFVPIEVLLLHFTHN